MRGTVVIVRALGDRPLIRRIWETTEKTVYITDDEQLQRHAAGLPMLAPIGFPIEDVFSFSREAIVGDNVDWKKLKLWQGNR